MGKWGQIFLKNVSQVILLENIWAGVLILIALWIGNWKVGLAAMIGSALSMLTAKYFNYSDEEIQSGLAGFNSVLIAIDLTLFLEWSWQALLIIILSIILSMPTAQAIKSFLRPLNLPELTMPFVIITWIVLLMSEQFKFIKTNVNVLPLTTNFKVDLDTPFKPIQAFLENLSQIFLVEHMLAGLLIIIACFVASRHVGICVILANILGLIFEFILGADIATINHGLFGFNLILAIIAIGHTFKSQNHLNPIVAFILTVLMTPMAYAALATFFDPIGIPILTFPFILVTWTLLLAGQPKQQTN
ncbi:urea transporter [Staphylococcus sp. H16/1A]|uniref:Urea transporter n=1 Tax=Staphylococcus canis TaxID=2724942 RepID=A0ABS0T7S5_9STAP|nr:urea transporter [Staphylococcus canis]MBI5974467.1 urea transporter [Staphylococcus canis]